MNKEEKLKLRSLQSDLDYTLNSFVTEEYRRTIIRNVIDDIGRLMNK
jgi:hypothetical protein